MAEPGKVLTGARTRFSLQGKKVGFARNVTVREEIRHERLETLDLIQIEEDVPTGYYVTFTAGRFRIINQSLKSLGFFPQTGNTPEEHLTNILNTGEMTATLEDTRTGTIWATVERVKIQSFNFTVDARGVIGEDVEFLAIRIKDESEI